jgi:glycosyltransferase involved in cell wall biosynthesis
MNKKALVRITTVPLSLDKLLEGQLRFMSGHYNVTAISSDRPYLEKIGRKENVPVYHLAMTRQITPVKDIIAVLRLFFFLKKNKPFIVHTHTPKAGIVGMLASKMAGVPNRFHTVAGLPLLEASGIKRVVLDFVEKVTYSCATNVYPNSFGLFDIITKNNYCRPEKLKVLANGSTNGIDTAHFSPADFSPEQRTALRKSLGIEDADFVFIFVGRLVGDKGINELVRAFAAFSENKSHVKLLLLGPLEQELDPLAPETLKMIDSNAAILTTGYQNDVRHYFAISDTLVFPSYREGFPNVVMQAGAMGLPCIVSNINGCNEIIAEDENGLIIPVKDEQAIFEAMMRMYDNKALRQKMQDNARSMIVRRYEQLTVWNAILEEYRKFEN